MVPFVQSNQVINVNGENYAWPNYPNGISMQVPVSGTQIIDSYWRVPQTQGPRVIGYAELVATDAVKPSPDAVKFLRVKLTGTGGITQIDMAITDSDNLPGSTPPNQFAYLADSSGGALPVMPNVTIPIPIMQQDAQSTNSTTGAKTFVFPFPANPGALLYQVNGMWLNGTLIVPTMTGLTTVALVATYFNTTYPVYGTWSSVGDVLKLVSAPTDTTPVTKGGIDVELAPKAWCFNLTPYSTPAAVDGLKFGTGGTIPVPNFLLTDDPIVLMNVLKTKMSVGTTYNATSVAHKLTVTTVQAQPKLYLGTTLVVASAAGVCS